MLSQILQYYSNKHLDDDLSLDHSEFTHYKNLSRKRDPKEFKREMPFGNIVFGDISFDEVYDDVEELNDYFMSVNEPIEQKYSQNSSTVSAFSNSEGSICYSTEESMSSIDTNDKYVNYIDKDEDTVGTTVSLTIATDLSPLSSNPLTNRYGDSGMIYTRSTSRIILILRPNWKKLYWLHVYPTSILFFKSYEKCQVWKKLNKFSSILTNEDNKAEYDQWKDDKLIKWSVNMDSNNSTKNRKKQEDFDNTSNSEIISEIYGMGRVRTKKYGKQRFGPTEEIIHCFILTKETDNGTQKITYFGNKDPEELIYFRETVQQCMDTLKEYK